MKEFLVLQRESKNNQASEEIHSHFRLFNVQDLQ